MIELIKNIIGAIASFSLAFNTHNVILPLNNLNSENTKPSIARPEVQEDIAVENIKPLVGKVPSPAGTAWWSYPADIKEVTRSGNDLLVLVNKEFKLPSTYAPSDLVSASLSGIRKGENYSLRSILINDLKNLVTDAKADGIDLSIRSGYRSYNTQISTYNYWLSTYGGNVASTDKISARAGHSQHQLGTAVDFSSAEIADGLGGTFAGTKASKWLASNAWKYGFVISFPSGYENVTGYSYESWHYRYIGTAYAKEMIDSGMILENYLRSKN